MFVTLTEPEVVAQDAALRSDDGPQLIRFMALKRLFENPPADLHPMARIAHGLGWLAYDSPAAPLTETGTFVGDALREYVFWRDRGKTIQRQGAVPSLQPERMKGRRVVEVGCGFGCNLLTLSKYVDDLVGIDVVPVYLQVAPTLFELEDLPVPLLKLGRAEELPVAAASADVVLMLGALQYMDIPKAFSECARVLDRGGHFVAVNGYFAGFMRSAIKEFASSRSPRKAFVSLRTMFADTLYFLATGKRFRGGDGPSTAIPVYPTRRYLSAELRKAGLIPEDETRPAGDELIIVARKP